MGLSIASHLLAFVVFRVAWWHVSFFNGFCGVVLFFLVLSAGLSLVAFVTIKPLVFHAVLAFRALSVYVIVYSFGPNVDIGIVLLIGFVFEVSTYLRFPTNCIVNIAVLGAGLVVHSAGVVAFAETLPTFVPDVLVGWAGLGVLTAVGGLMTYHRERLISAERDAMRFGDAVGELTRTQSEFLRIATTSKRDSAVEERNRITREIHDTVGYTLTNVMMMLEAAQDLVPDGFPGLREKLAGARKQTQLGLEGTRRALYLLRSRDQGDPIGLPAIQHMVDTFSRASGVAVDAEYGNMPMCTVPDTDAAIYHLIQESLINALRHGGATAVRVTMWVDAEDYRVTVRDNGGGCDVLEEGIGIRGMRERFGKLGGTLKAANVVDGFEITARIPRPGEDGV